MVLIAQRYFHYCQAGLKVLFCFSPQSTSEEAGSAQGAGRWHRQVNWAQLIQGIFHPIQCHAQHVKLGVRRRETFGAMVFVPLSDGALLSWVPLNTCLPMRSDEWIPWFALLACLAFALPINLSLHKPMGFLTLPIQFSAPPHLHSWMSKQEAAWAWLLAGVKPQQAHNYIRSVFSILATLQQLTMFCYLFRSISF